MSSETQDRPAGKSRMAGYAAILREEASKCLKLAEELDPRCEAQVDAVERVFAEAYDSAPDGYWRDAALAAVEEAEKALFGVVGEGVTSRG